MPHTNRKPQSRPGFKPATFVNTNLSPDDVAAIKAMSLDASEFDKALDTLQRGDYRISLRYDIYNDCSAAWILGPNAGPNSGLILSGRGSTPMKALRQVLYIHFRVYEGRWAAPVERGPFEIDD